MQDEPKKNSRSTVRLSKKDTPRIVSNFCSEPVRNNNASFDSRQKQVRLVLPWMTRRARQRNGTILDPEMQYKVRHSMMGLIARRKKMERQKPLQQVKGRKRCEQILLSSPSMNFFFLIRQRMRVRMQRQAVRRRRRAVRRRRRRMRKARTRSQLLVQLSTRKRKRRRRSSIKRTQIRWRMQDKTGERRKMRVVL